MRSLIVLLLIAFSGCSNKQNNEQTKEFNEETFTETAHNISDLINQYTEIRDKFVKYFHSIDKFTDIIDKQDTDSLKVLELMLKDILKYSKYENFVNTGRINLVTLQNDYGFGLTDGLYIEKDSFNIYITSKKIFSKYFPGKNIYKFNEYTLEEVEELLNNTLNYPDLDIYSFIDFRLVDKSNAFGVLCGTFEPFPPSIMLTIFIDDEFIYIVEQEPRFNTYENFYCLNINDSINTLYNLEIEELYSMSLLLNFISPKDQSHTMYIDCFRNSFQFSKEFITFEVQIKEVVRLFYNH